jgi:Protein of unknown function (DUF3309)
MLGTILIVLLLLLLLGALPNGLNRENCCYGPTGGQGLKLVLLVILLGPGRI